MSYRVERVRTELTPTAVIRDRVRPEELPRFVPAACGEVWKFAKAAGLRQPGRHTALYLSEGIVEVGVEVADPFVGDDRVICSQLPGGEAATTILVGPYGQLPEAHAAIRAWCADRGLRCSGVSWEIYGHWDPSWNSDPSRIRTDVLYLLEEESA